ncbi:MAG: SDR family oxidoreductase [Saprospiraceae bacterium]|nr:SDR family oxidoreductase [Saprospiraceae bacterium]
MKDSHLDVTGKVIVITGGSGVLGGAMASHLMQQGAKMVIIGFREESVLKKLKELAVHGGEPLGLAVDVLDENQLKVARKQILDRWGRIDVLINAAGGNLRGATIDEDQTIFDVNTEDLQSVLDLNLMGSILPSLVFGQVMTEQRHGSIINISSMAAQQVITRVFGYSLAKAGIDMLTKWMAAEFAMKYGDGVRVNAVAPGFFLGNQNRHLLVNEDGSPTSRGEKILNMTPMARFGNVGELNGVIQFLASDASSFTTGAVIPIDGGFQIFSGV